MAAVDCGRIGMGLDKQSVRSRVNETSMGVSLLFTSRKIQKRQVITSPDLRCCADVRVAHVQLVRFDPIRSRDPNKSTGLAIHRSETENEPIK